MLKICGKQTWSPLSANTVNYCNILSVNVVVLVVVAVIDDTVIAYVVVIVLQGLSALTEAALKY